MLIENGTTPTIVFKMVDQTDGYTGETGLSPSVSLSKNGSAFAAATNSVSEIANGWYKIALTTTETDTDGPLILHATGTGARPTVDVHQVITTLPATVDASVLTFAGPVVESGNIELVQGDDYTVAAGQPLEWSSDSWPDLTGATINLKSQLNADNTTEFAKAGSVVTAGTGTQTVRVEPTKTDTAGLTVDDSGYTFQVKATLATGEVVTLVEGTMLVRKDRT